MDMVAIARGFGVDGEIVRNPGQMREALARARAHTVEGEPYLLDVQVARKGVGWAEKPWIPPLRVASLRTKKV
jgi:benzoylformate decarboxylase